MSLAGAASKVAGSALTKGLVAVIALDATSVSALGSILSGAAALLAAGVAVAGAVVRYRRKNGRHVDTDDVDVPLGATESETAHYLIAEIARLRAEMEAKKEKP